MKVRVALAVILLSGAAFAGIAAGRSGQASPAGLWRNGSCYRVYLDDERPPHLVKVAETSEMPWVRVEPQPAGPRIPGARERDPLWINTSELFAAQEAACPSAVGR